MVKTEIGFIFKKSLLRNNLALKCQIVLKKIIFQIKLLKTGFVANDKHLVWTPYVTNHCQKHDFLLKYLSKIQFFKSLGLATLFYLIFTTLLSTMKTEFENKL